MNNEPEATVVFGEINAVALLAQVTVHRAWANPKPPTDLQDWYPFGVKPIDRPHPVQADMVPSLANEWSRTSSSEYVSQVSFQFP